MSKDSFFDDYFNIPDENNIDEWEYEDDYMTEEEYLELIEDEEYSDEEDEDDYEEDEEDDEYSDIDPEEYTEDMVSAMNEIIRIESGIDEPDNEYTIKVYLPMLISPVNKYLRFIKYPYEKSMIVELLNKGWSIENAISYTCQERIQYYINDYVIKDDNGNLIYEDELENLDIEDDMFPDINEPFWKINI